MNSIKRSIIKATSLIIAVNIVCSAFVFLSTNKHIGKVAEQNVSEVTCCEPNEDEPDISNIADNEENVNDINDTGLQKEVELVKKVRIIKKYDVPDMDTSFKTYMSYKCITNKNSEQYKLQTQAWTDEDGLRRIGDAYLVAMGTFYSDHCGKVFEITFDTDETITVIVGDIKNDLHTDKNNQYSPVYNANGKLISANILEFIIDPDVINKQTKRLGSVENCANLQGNIVSIIEIEDKYTALFEEV